ncbi:MAG: hypothetical protein EPN91_08290 [Salinibacterium sp.]|nr:MAG: hypothetical protein EPN91_08290 [Salinibacterium sp.]
MNCDECDGALVCPLPNCVTPIHLHQECHEFRIALDKFSTRWWGWWNFKQRVRFELTTFFPRLRFRFVLWYYRFIVIQRIGFKHGSMSPACVLKNSRCVSFHYQWNERYELKPIGWSCTECGWVIEGDWREMQKEIGR